MRAPTGQLIPVGARCMDGQLIRQGIIVPRIYDTIRCADPAILVAEVGILDV
jgi:hypothetical protein